MPKFLLDKFVKSKLDQQSFSYNSQGWKSMESMLNSKQGISFWKGLSLAPKVVGSVAATGIIGSLICYSLFNNNTVEQKYITSNKTQNTSVSIPVSSNENTVNLADTKLIEVKKQSISTTKLPKNTTEEITVISSSDEVISTVQSSNSTMLSSENLVANTQSLVDNTIQTSSSDNISNPSEVAVEDKTKEVYTKPRPIPAKDVFNKKKRRGLLYFFGFKH